MVQDQQEAWTEASVTLMQNVAFKGAMTSLRACSHAVSTLFGSRIQTSPRCRSPHWKQWASSVKAAGNSRASDGAKGAYTVHMRHGDMETGDEGWTEWGGSAPHRPSVCI